MSPSSRPPAPAVEPSAPRGPGTAFAMIAIDDRCTACGNCIITCPPRALRPASKKPLLVPQRCTGCLACLEVCPTDAISELRTGPLAMPGAAVGGQGDS